MEFEGNFLSSARPKPTAASLLRMRQKEEEHLGQYLASFTNERPRGGPSRGPPFGLPRRRMERGEQTMPRLPDRSLSNVLLNSTRTEIFLQIREKGLLKTPNPLRSRAEDRDHRRYCHFHRNYGYDTEECYDLKNQIEDLIHRGHLD
ncbi:hypothetical protein GW17_00057135 [Ensete ventricosum]|nr:hypothetical protein GW17_00057135 [Ensete ventricosum]